MLYLILLNYLYSFSHFFVLMTKYILKYNIPKFTMKENLLPTSTSEPNLSGQSNQYELDPTATHYKIGRSRPTVAQLRKGAKNSVKIKAPAQEGAEHTVGTFIGVLSPCFDNIINIVYFVRLPYVISQAGGLATVVGWIVSFFMVLISVFSLSAMATNGEVESGGAY
ncbi:hypothetical protein TRFO_36392 [Tritrichomonas foetus]|uniref:Amino acid permease/ SLC12A domain-containing protein n=1 Tax=Tritrichomonas foetus TaxID=1144522 RepID=A0A1J4JIL4_9EUKA|nr:hypothetical protein TRFO_36392 [Tritrichomonas foetus]|eukprot:OHS97387.1 hypothetical protein TRFO_36392 [Tritrichomonas foetus]